MFKRSFFNGIIIINEINIFLFYIYIYISHYGIYRCRHRGERNLRVIFSSKFKTYLQQPALVNKQMGLECGLDEPN